MTTRRHAQPRERETGRYGFEGQWDRLCVCGHALRWHLAEAPHSCAIEDAHNMDPARMPTPQEPCAAECERFRPLRLTAAQERVMRAVAAVSDLAAGVDWRALPARPGAVRGMVHRLSTLGLLTLRIDRPAAEPAVPPVEYAMITEAGRALLTPEAATTAPLSRVSKYTVPPFSQIRRDRGRRGVAHVEDERCAICDKPITNEATAHPAIVIDGGAAWGDESSPVDAGHMGGFLVGPDCHRRFVVRA